MSWYSTPIQPLDPVVQSQTPKPPVRYMRDNFSATGQNSYVKPPAQDQAMWQALTNVQPITQGILNQRWGYTTLATLANPTTTADRLYSYQSDALGTRAIINTNNQNVSAFTEAGAVYNSSIFTPEAAGNIIRSCTSRNYQYFCDGFNATDLAHRTGDSLKWDGSPSGGTTNIGINVNDVTINTSTGGSSSTTFGPNRPGAASDLGGAHPWTSPGNLTGSTPTTNRLSVGPQFTSFAVTTDSVSTSVYGMAVPSGTISGISVTATVKISGQDFNNCNFTVQLMKAGALVGTTKTGTVVGAANDTIKTYSSNFAFGSSTDTWGSTWTLADVNATNFGLQFNCSTQSIFVPDTPPGDPGWLVDTTISVSNVKITVYTAISGGSSTTSGNGVGILSSVAGGNVTLVLGRTYYLVANTSTIGHFSDLTRASGSTGTSLNAEFNLLLATFNDPQVDTKYVLATADGGDPSILYETSVLIPGLTITSWAIVANVVTFTGTYTGAAPANGSTVVIGGLSHGNYMNNQTLTVTSTTPTTLVAAFTHANDSATEPGIAGNYSFAIPNGVTYVVDNTTDPNLVLNQALVFTDNFGNEFGLALNDPPPAGNLIIKHQGRLWMAGVPGATHSIFFSKSISELTLPNGFIAGKYEEAWPGSNYFDVSDGAESVAGLLSDGTSLYIGTQSHIRRLLGNSPVNFQEPAIVHPEVGLINQEVWQIVFMQGAPSGSIWMTPDFRVIQSDFNTYVDIGAPIQDILNNLQPSAQTLAHATFFADGEYDLYALAVPYLQSTYCDTILVFDLRHRQWFVWQIFDGSVAMLYNITQAGAPQWMFVHIGHEHLHVFSSAATTDDGVPITVTATTTWMHLGEPTRRKLLNEIQIYGNTGMTMSIYGANNQAEFSSPTPVVYNRTLRQSPFNVWTMYLTGAKTRHRFYQFTFSANNGQIPFLGSYAISLAALDDI